MGVSSEVKSGRIGIGGGKGESIGGVVRRGGAKQGGGNGTVRDYGLGMREGSTK